MGERGNGNLFTVGVDLDCYEVVEVFGEFDIAYAHTEGRSLLVHVWKVFNRIGMAFLNFFIIKIKFVSKKLEITIGVIFDNWTSSFSFSKFPKKYVKMLKKINCYKMKK